MTRNPEHRKRLAEAMVRDGASAKAAILHITETETITELAAAAALTRHHVDECLGGRRPLAHVRRALELHAGLPVYALDGILTETGA